MMYYLSGDDEMGKSKKNKKEKKRKGKKRRVAKVALAPARKAFLVVTSLNLLRTGKKLARVWNKSGGKDRLSAWWIKLGGDPEKLKKAIAKGSKETINASDMGVIAETTIATATALLIAVAPIIKAFGAGGDKEEAKEFDEGIEKGKQDLENDPDIEKSSATVPDGEEVGILKGRGAGGKEDISKSKEKKDGDETGLNLATNPVTISFIVPLFLASFGFTNPLAVTIAEIVSLYCVIGVLVIPFSEWNVAGTGVAKISRKYFDVPALWFNKTLNFFSHGKK